MNCIVVLMQDYLYNIGFTSWCVKDGVTTFSKINNDLKVIFSKPDNKLFSAKLESSNGKNNQKPDTTQIVLKLDTVDKVIVNFQRIFTMLLNNTMGKLFIPSLCMLTCSDKAIINNSSLHRLLMNRVKDYYINGSVEVTVSTCGNFPKMELKINSWYKMIYKCDSANMYPILTESWNKNIFRYCEKHLSKADLVLSIMRASDTYLRDRKLV